MNNQKGVSTLIAIIIVVAVAVVAVGGVFAYQYFAAKTQPVVQTQQDNQSPVLKVNGPQSLDLNQLGTWTVDAYSPNDKGEGSTLTYSVKWADVTEAPRIGNDFDTTDVQTSTFTHAYSKFGTYTIVFTAKDSTGAQTSTSTSVRVMNTTSPGLNATSNWKTYTNNEFNYSFKYPTNWTVWEANPILGLIILYPNSKSEEVINKTISTTDKITFGVVNGQINKTEMQQNNIGGQSWFSKTYNKLDGGTENGIEYEVDTNNNKYIDITTGISNKGTLLEMLSTFKFTK